VDLHSYAQWRVPLECLALAERNCGEHVRNVPLETGADGTANRQKALDVPAVTHSPKALDCSRAL